MKKVLALAVLPLLLAACAGSNGNKSAASNYGMLEEESLDSGTPSQSVTEDTSYMLAAAPKYLVGMAYKVEDVQYIPMEDMTYNQTGVAGIIPVELNGTQTSNGETFDVNQMVATSKTLPLPTIAKITNLDNGNTLLVRVNNRGPFVNSRIMDVSPAAAKKLGMSGNTKVQVQVVQDQSLQVKNATLGATATPVAPAATEVTAAPVVETTEVAPAAGPYTVQVAAFYSQENADSLAQRLGSYGDVKVENEGGMYKVRILNLDASSAKKAIEGLRSSEGMSPGLLKSGKWVNADSI